MAQTFKIILSLSLICACGCATANVKTVKRGNVSASMEKAIQDTKDALNTYGFDIQDIDDSGRESSVTGERVSGQKAWVEIDSQGGSSSTIKVKVNQAGKDKVGADVIFDDIKARSPR